MISLRDYLKASSKEKKKMERKTLHQIKTEKHTEEIYKKILLSKEFKSLVKEHMYLNNTRFKTKVTGSLEFEVMFEENLQVSFAEFIGDDYAMAENSKEFKALQVRFKNYKNNIKSLSTKYSVDIDFIDELIWLECR